MLHVLARIDMGLIEKKRYDRYITKIGGLNEQKFA
jgi:hypothetical protein